MVVVLNPKGSFIFNTLHFINTLFITHYLSLSGRDHLPKNTFGEGFLSLYNAQQLLWKCSSSPYSKWMNYGNQLNLGPVGCIVFNCIYTKFHIMNGSVFGQISTYR